MALPDTGVLPGSECVGHVIDGRFVLLRWVAGTDQSSIFLTELEGGSAQRASIKLIPAGTVDADARINQWSTARTLSHPHLMRLFHFGRCKIEGADYLYVVTEYAEEVLSEVLPERPLTTGETREMLAPVLDALAYLHVRHLVHGALKPSNILVVNDKLKLSIDTVHRVGEQGRNIPTFSIYNAPELAKGIPSPAEDMWSLGVLISVALTQKTPVWDKSKGGEPVAPASLAAPFLRISQECLHLDPARRPTLGDVKSYLDTPRASARAVHSAASSAAKSRFNINVITAVTAVVVVVGIVIAVIKMGSHPAPQPAAPPAVGSQTATEPDTPSPDVPKQQRTPGQIASAKGAIVHQALPNVPQQALDTIQGHFYVAIRVQVDPSGNVSDATIDSPGPSKYFADLALKAARNWKFQPAQPDGHPASAWLLQFAFSKTGTAATAVTSPH
jgi:TonB family protein